MNSSLPSTVTPEDFFKECPRFRILTLGKTGVGKATLIKHAFKADQMQGSDKEPGKCDINDEINSPENTRFVLHNYQLGESGNLNKLKDFMQRRAHAPEIKDQLHAIWLCMRMPHAGGRLIEAVGEEFWKLDFGDVPVILVFTHYDVLYEYTPYEVGSVKLGSLDENQRKIHVEQEYIDRLNGLSHRPKKLGWVKVSSKNESQHTLIDVVQTTYKLLHNNLAESVQVALAAAQRVDVDLNVKNSIRVGMKGYWQGLASGIHFSKKSIPECLDIIYKDTVKIWNFPDSGKIFEKGDLKNMIILNLPNLVATNPGFEL